MRHMLLIAAIVHCLGAQAPVSVPAPDPFGPAGFLVGDWTGAGDGKPGQNTGSASFRFEVADKVLVRRNQADSAPTSTKPAFHHEDLMTVYAEGGQLKALYLDNEGHVIRYLVTPVPGGVAFTSEPAPGPRFRLTYLRKAEALVTVRFEIAPPDKPAVFATYLEATMRRSN